MKSDHADVERVKRQVLAAFSSLPLPEPGQLLGPATGDAAGEERIREALAGKAWQELDAAFLAGHWSAFCYLSAEGYRYYLPALLMGAFRPFSESNDLTHTASFRLAPSYWRLYYERHDAHFAYQTSLFTRDQYAAVCAFLGLGLTGLGGYPFQSAQALRWGWNGWETPAGANCREFYHRLFHYEYPVPENPQAQRIVAQVREAFADTPYPGDYELCGSSQGDEPAEYALEFQGRDWRTLHPEFLAHNYASLSFFSGEGFRYFLPAYLIASLLEDETGVETNGDPIFHLTHGLRDADQARETPSRYDWYTVAVQKFSSFTRPERQAIVAYLQHSQNDEYEREGIAQALERYWFPSLIS